MIKKALLITGQQSETVSTLARNLINVGGISIFARQMKQMKAIGVDEMHVVTDWFVQEFQKEIDSCTKRPEKIFIHSTKDAPIKLLEHNQVGSVWFLLEEGVIIDERIITQVDRFHSPSVITLIEPHSFLDDRTANGIPLQIAEKEGFFGSIAKLSSQTLTANALKLNSLEEFPNALKAIARASDCEILPLTDIPLYIPSRRRNVDLVWFPVIRREDEDKGTNIILEFSQKGALDWPAWYLHRHIENLIVKHICKLPITPNQITLATGILGFYVMYLFATGDMITGLTGAYIVGIFDGVDGKLARTKMMMTKLGEFEHFLDKVVEYAWYIGIASYLSNTYNEAPYIMATALIFFHLADEIQSEFFRRMTNGQICDAGTFDRKFRLIGGRRNTQMWALLPFALFDQWYLGFAFICAYGIITFFVHQLRIVYHLKNHMVENSGLFSENFDNTKIF